MPPRPSKAKHVDRRKTATWEDQRELHVSYAYGPVLQAKIEAVTVAVHYTGPQPEGTA